MTGVLIKGENLDDTHRGKDDVMRHREDGHLLPRRENWSRFLPSQSPEGTSPANSLGFWTSHLQNCAQRISVAEAHRWQYIVTAA